MGFLPAGQAGPQVAILLVAEVGASHDAVQSRHQITAQAVGAGLSHTQPDRWLRGGLQGDPRAESDGGWARSRGRWGCGGAWR